MKQNYKKVSLELIDLKVTIQGTGRRTAIEAEALAVMSELVKQRNKLTEDTEKPMIDIYYKQEE